VLRAIDNLLSPSALDDERRRAAQKLTAAAR